MAFPSYQGNLNGLPLQPTCWLVAAKLPATPPNVCVDSARETRAIMSSPRLPLPTRRPSLALDCTGSAGLSDGQHTPALSQTSSTSDSSHSSTLSSASSAPSLVEASFKWHKLTSPDHLPPNGSNFPSTRTLARSQCNRHIDGDLPGHIELQRHSVQSKVGGRTEPYEDTIAQGHPRIQKAMTDRRPGFVEGLVDVSEIAITSIWSSAAAEAHVIADDGSVLPLRWFIKETLRRSRTSCSTLQLALFYLHKSRMVIRDRVLGSERAKADLARIAAIKSYPTPPASPQEEFVPTIDALRSHELLVASRDPVCCGRRMFLASLVCASKFLQDRNYSSRAWSKISGLAVQEINANERALLHVLNYELFVRADLFANWTQRLESLADEYARKQGREPEMHDDLPLSPDTPAESEGRSLLAMPLSSADYVADRQLTSDMHATLPTPTLPHQATSIITSMKRSESERALRPSCRAQDFSTVMGTATTSGWLMTPNPLRAAESTVL